MDLDYLDENGDIIVPLVPLELTRYQYALSHFAPTPKRLDPRDLSLDFSSGGVHIFTPEEIEQRIDALHDAARCDPARAKQFLQEAARLRAEIEEEW